MSGRRREEAVAGASGVPGAPPQQRERKGRDGGEAFLGFVEKKACYRAISCSSLLDFGGEEGVRWLKLREKPVGDMWGHGPFVRFLKLVLSSNKSSGLPFPFTDRLNTVSVPGLTEAQSQSLVRTQKITTRGWYLSPAGWYLQNLRHPV